MKTYEQVEVLLHHSYCRNQMEMSGHLHPPSAGWATDSLDAVKWRKTLLLLDERQAPAVYPVACHYTARLEGHFLVPDF